MPFIPVMEKLNFKQRYCISKKFKRIVYIISRIHTIFVQPIISISRKRPNAAISLINNIHPPVLVAANVCVL